MQSRSDHLAGAEARGWQLRAPLGFRATAPREPPRRVPALQQQQPGRTEAPCRRRGRRLPLACTTTHPKTVLVASATYLPSTLGSEQAAQQRLATMQRHSSGSIAASQAAALPARGAPVPKAGAGEVIVGDLQQAAWWGCLGHASCASVHQCRPRPRTSCSSLALRDAGRRSGPSAHLVRVGAVLPVGLCGRVCHLDPVGVPGSGSEPLISTWQLGRSVPSVNCLTGAAVHAAQRSCWPPTPAC